jgi:hypothetical protein
MGVWQAEQRKQEMKDAELAGVTWRPKITKMAQAIRRDADCDDPYARLTRRGSKKSKVTTFWSAQRWNGTLWRKREGGGGGEQKPFLHPVTCSSLLGVHATENARWCFP